MRIFTQISTTIIVLLVGASTSLGQSEFEQYISSEDDVLPIKLVQFEAHYQDGEVNLNWTTIGEVNNDFFTIERSYDAKTWTGIIHVDGAGHSENTRTYSETDHPENQTSYYRLKQTDFSGESTFSDIVSVTNGYKSPQVYLYPNPVSSGLFNVFFQNVEGQLFTVSILDALGTEMEDYTVLEVNMQYGVIPIQHSLNAGLYVLEFSSNEFSYATRFIVK